MKYRTVDANGDMMPIQSADQMSEGAEAVALAVDSRLAMYYGEWWEDETLGFRIPRFLIDGVREFQIPMLEKYISKYISSTEGVTGVVGIVTEYEGRKFTYYCKILTRNGSTELGVASDGILRAIY